jgi:undecaprenyl-phosphate galactose phosphotransferase/putative colanic acid biosynthesis UDP-glucose lipid carrier transferase
MKKSKFGFSKYVPIINALLDIGVINFSYFVSHFYRFPSFQWIPNQSDLEFLFLVNFLWAVILYYHESIEFNRTVSFENIFRRYASVFFLYAATLYLFLFMLNRDEVSRLWILYYLITSFIGMAMARVVSLLFFKWYRKHGKNYRKIVIVGTDSVSIQLFHYLKNDLTLGFKVLGFFDFSKNGADLEKINGAHYLGDRSSLLHYLQDHEVDEVYWKLGGDLDPNLKSVVEFCENNLIRFRMVPFLGLDVLGRKPHIDMYNLIPVVTLRKEPLQLASNRLMKRTFDFVFSFLLLLVLAPTVFLLIAVLIKIFSPGPVFFKQLRSGENNREFWCFKFRTMKVNLLSDELQATKNDVRITPLGSFLRKTSLDELPQFWNVLKGEMSVVGPRPHMLKHTAEYSQTVSKFLVRHFAKPGITGWAQINGFRGETKELEDMEKRVEADIWYVENWSLLLDARIVILTVVNMFRGEKNAY